MVTSVHARTVLALLGLAFLACSACDQPCACNGNWSDPFARPGQPTAQANVPHYRSDHCICQCGGEGEELLMPPFQRDCAAFEVACRTSEGRSATYVCR